MEKLNFNEIRYMVSLSIGLFLISSILTQMTNTSNDSIGIWIIMIVFAEILGAYFKLLDRSWKTQVIFHPDKIIFKNQKNEESAILWVDVSVELKWKKFHFLNYFYPVTFKSRKDKNISVKIILFLVDSKSVKELNEKYVPKDHVFYSETKKLFP